MWFVIYIIVGLVCGFVTKTMNEEKGYDGGFLWGFFLTILGIIVVAVRPYNPDKNKDTKNDYHSRERKNDDPYGLYVKSDFLRSENMSEDEISEWLNEKGFGEYVQTFKDNDLMDVKLLKSLTDSDLEKLGIASMGKRKSLLYLLANEMYKKMEFEGEKDDFVIEDGQVLGGVNGQILKRTYWCRNNLESVIIQDGIHYIGVEAFQGCNNLKSVVLPVTISSIDNSAFEDCPKLERIRFLGNKQQWALVKRGLCWNKNVAPNFKISVKANDGSDVLLK